MNLFNFSKFKTNRLEPPAYGTKQYDDINPFWDCEHNCIAPRYKSCYMEFCNSELSSNGNDFGRIVCVTGLVNVIFYPLIQLKITESFVSSFEASK